MTIDKLQNEMFLALKAGDRFRKITLSTIIAQIKRAAIDRGDRNNIDEALVDSELQKVKKQIEDSISTCPSSRTDLLTNYNKQKSIIMEFVPALIEDENEIQTMILNSGFFTGEKACQGAVMKYMKQEFAGKIDMKKVSQVFREMVK